MTQALQTMKQPREIRVVEDSGPLAFLMDTSRFEHMYRIANAMAIGTFIPAHIKGKTPEETAGNCFRVVNQAVRWGLDPFAVVDETYSVKGKLGYQGKLIAAVVNTRSDIKSKLRVVYNTKAGDAFAAVVYGSTGEIPEEAHDLLMKYAEQEDRTALAALGKLGVLAARITIGQAKTDNKMWKEDPEQKLFYSGAAKWARRHRPEVMLGVLTEDDVDRMGHYHQEAALPAPPVTLVTAGTPSTDVYHQQDPPNGNGSKPMSQAQRHRIQEECGRTGEPEASVLEAYKVHSLDELTSEQADECIRRFAAVGAERQPGDDE